jgi:hypothetical protein
MPAILSIIANIAKPVPAINSYVPTVSANLVSICPDFKAVSAQLLLRCAFAPVLAILARITATIY